MSETDELMKRLRLQNLSDIRDDGSPGEHTLMLREAADRLEALEALLRAGADIVAGTWDGVYGLEDELDWVKEVEALTARNTVASPISPKKEGSIEPAALREE